MSGSGVSVYGRGFRPESRAPSGPVVRRAPSSTRRSGSPRGSSGVSVGLAERHERPDAAHDRALADALALALVDVPISAVVLALLLVVGADDRPGLGPDVRTLPAQLYLVTVRNAPSEHTPVGPLTLTDRGRFRPTVRPTPVAGAATDPSRNTGPSARVDRQGWFPPPKATRGGRMPRPRALRLPRAAVPPPRGPGRRKPAPSGHRPIRRRLIARRRTRSRRLRRRCCRRPRSSRRRGPFRA